MADTESIKNEFIDLFLGTDTEKAVSRAKEVLDGGMDAIDFFESIFTPSMEAIGEKFGNMEIYLAELIQAADHAKAVTDEAVEPVIKSQGSELKKLGKIVLASVKGDHHDIGKNMVKMMLTVNGFDVIDLGVDVATKVILETAMSEKADIVALSALMTTSLPYMEEIIEWRNEMGDKDDFKIIVGGAPVHEDYSQEIGADAYGDDAGDAVKRCTELMKS